jgi:senataxin
LKDERHYFDVNTVDGFQGREKDIVIFSCVRSHDPQSGRNGIGFLSDVRRMNVAITRAKSSLYVIGNDNTLESNSDWKDFVEHVKSHGSFIEVVSSSPSSS